MFLQTQDRFINVDNISTITPNEDGSVVVYRTDGEWSKESLLGGPTTRQAANTILSNILNPKKEESIV